MPRFPFEIRGSFLNNVFHLDHYRNPVSHAGETLIIRNPSLESLQLFSGLQFLKSSLVLSAEGLERLNRSLSPSIIVIESDLAWAQPIKLIDWLHSTFDVPILLLWNSKKKSTSMLRQAYAAGVSDVLFAPFFQEDLEETLDVLLKIRQQKDISHD